MNISKLITILSNRQAVYRANANTLQRIIDIIVRFEMYKNMKGGVLTIDDSELGPDKNIMAEIAAERKRVNEAS